MIHAYHQTSPPPYSLVLALLAHSSELAYDYDVPITSPTLSIRCHGFIGPTWRQERVPQFIDGIGREQFGAQVDAFRGRQPLSVSVPEIDANCDIFAPPVMTPRECHPLRVRLLLHASPVKAYPSPTPTRDRLTFCKIATNSMKRKG